MLKFAQYSWRVAGVALVLLWLFQTFALAAIYKWRDDNGKMHFTDDRSKIPLKYQQDLLKFKGAPPPPGTAKGEAAEGESEEESEEQSEASMSPGPGTEAAADSSQQQPPPKPKNKYTADEMKVMAMVYQSLMSIWGTHVRLVSEMEVIQKNLVRYAQTAEQSATQKKTMYKTIGKWEIPILLKVRSYLKRTIKKDRRLKKDSDDLMKKVKTYYKRLMSEIPKERELLEEFNVELALNAQPLPTLAVELAKGEARRKAKKQHKRKKPSGNSKDRSDSDSPIL